MSFTFSNGKPAFIRTGLAKDSNEYWLRFQMKPETLYRSNQDMGFFAVNNDFYNRVKASTYSVWVCRNVCKLSFDTTILVLESLIVFTGDKHENLVRCLIDNSIINLYIDNPMYFYELESL